MTLKDTPNVTSSPESVAGQLRLDLPDIAMTSPCGQEAAHASPLAQPEGEKATATSATYGRIGLGSLSPSSLQSCMESKLHQLLPTAGGMMWPQTWKLKVTPAGRQYCQLAVSVSRTKETGCGLWPTPTCHNAKQNGYPAEYKRNTIQLGSIAAMWPTPQASDNRDRGVMENPSTQRRIALGKQIGLSQICNGSNAQTGKRGQLNPAFVSWLMGYSTAHLSSMHSAMQSYRNLRQNL